MTNALEASMRNYTNIEHQEQRRAASLVALSDAELDQVSGGQGRPGDSRPQPLLPGAEVQLPTGARIVLLPTGTTLLLPTGTTLEVTNDL
jgi:hypothetical protein